VNEEKFLERKTGTFSEIRPPLKQEYLTHAHCFSIHDKRGFFQGKIGHLPLKIGTPWIAFS